jgi:hypothetical protein
MSKEPMQQLREVHEIQGRKGCYDIDDYMLGLYNGLELALSLMEQRDVKYKEREALAKQEQPLPPVEIGVDVTSDGASVVAFYRRPNAVMEMFYSQFHPQPKQEQGEPVGEIISWPDDFSRLGVKWVDLCPPERTKLYTTPQPAQKPWVRLTDEDCQKIVQNFCLNVGDWTQNGKSVAIAIEAKLKEKNT